jgi:hypothetical protein
MAELISEPITPRTGTFDTARMGRGEPGLPTGFAWRGLNVDIVEELSAWKQSSREGGDAGDLYLRRHYFKLRMADGSIWTVYFVRQTPRSGDPKSRWFLYSVERRTRSAPPDLDAGETPGFAPGEDPRGHR